MNRYRAFLDKRKIGFLCIVLLSIIISTSTLAVPQKHQVGDIFWDESSIEMVYVSEGTFSLGIDADSLKALCKQHNEANPDECVKFVFEDIGVRDTQMLELQPFWIDRFEMIIAQFDKFCGVNANTDIDNCIPEPSDKKLILSPSQPQGYVSWYTADYICNLRNARLPTEAEWEYAASGPDRHIFAWGDTYTPDFIHFSDPKYAESYPVGSLPENKSWVGAFDMTGNVAEWVEDRFGTRILTSLNPEKWPIASPGNGQEIYRVLKGGEWDSPYWNLMNFYRKPVSPETISSNIGFRCARSLIPE